MLVGAFYFPTDYGIDIAELARALEAARVRVAVRVRAHAHPRQPEVRRFPAAASCPSATPTRTIRSWRCRSPPRRRKTLKLGTGICLVPQRDPIVTAKSVASLDQLSGGRFIFAIGGGWNVEEMENHGAQYETRFKLLRERVLAMKALWTQEEAEFHGEFVNFDRSGSIPSPSRGRIRRSSSAARATIP